MVGPLLHLATPAEWRKALAAGVVAPPSLDEVGFVHLSTPEQVALPAGRLFRGRSDLMLLVLDPGRIGVEVRYEPGVPSDPASLRLPHAYGPVPTAAALAVLPYRPRPDGGFEAPTVPRLDAAGRLACLGPSMLRRVATSEIPVTGGVAVLTAPLPGSYEHNQLLIDGEVDAAQLVADADRTLGGAGHRHRRAQLTGAHLTGAQLTGARQTDLATGLAERGWQVERLVGMVASAGGARDEHVEQVGIADPSVAQPADRVENAAVDLRHLAVRDGGRVVAGCTLTIDGGTARLHRVCTDPAYRRRGLGHAVVTEARAVAGSAGCDLVVVETAAAGPSRRWYSRRGFVEVTESWTAERKPTDS